MKLLSNMLLLLFLLPWVLSAQPVQVRLQLGHADFIHTVSFTPDGQYILTGDHTGALKRWNLQGVEINSYNISADVTGTDMFGRTVTQTLTKLPVNHAEVSADGQYVMAAALDKLVIFKLDGTLLKEITNFGMGGVATFTPSGQYVLAGKIIGPPTFHDLQLNNAGSVPVQGATLLKYSPDGSAIAIASMQEPFRLIDAKQGQLLQAFSGAKPAPVDNKVNFSPDGQRIVLANKLGVSVFTMDGKLAFSPTLSGAPADACFSKDGKLIVAHGKQISIFDANGRLLAAIPTPANATAVAASPTDPMLFASGHQDFSAQLWTIDGDAVNAIVGEGSKLTGVAVSPNGTLMAVADEMGYGKIWDLETNEIIPFNHGSPIMAFAYSDDYVVTGAENNTIKVWNWRGGLVATHQHTGGTQGFTSLETGITALSMIPNGNYIMSGGSDRQVLFWETKESNKRAGAIASAGDPYVASAVTAVAYGPDEQYYLTSRQEGYNANDDMAVFDKDGKFIRSLGTKGIRTATFLANGKQLIAGGKFGAALYGIAPGAAGASLNGDDTYAVAASADGKWLATGGANGKVYVWNSAGQPMFTGEAHVDKVRSLCFSADGTRLFSAGNDGTVRIWDLASKKELAMLVPHAKNSTDYAIMLPNKQYAASRNGTKGINFFMGSNVYSFEQFDLKYNRPQEVYKRLAYMPGATIDAVAQAYEKRFKKLGLQASAVDKPANIPSVKTGIEKYVSVVNAEQFGLQAAIDGNGLQLSSVNIYMNGVPLFGASGKSVGASSASISETLTLTPGKNVIQIEAVNVQGDKMLEEKHIFYRNPNAAKPNLHIFAVGVSKFADAKHNLLYPVKDAQDIIALFRQQEGKQFGKVSAHTLFDEQVTKESMLAFRSKLEQTDVNDMVIFYYSGHGLLSPSKDYYLSTYAVDFADASKGGLAYEALEGLLDKIPARKKILLLDACHSGELDKEDATAVVDANTTEIDDSDLDALLENSKGNTAIKVGGQSTFEMMGFLFNDLRSNIGATIVSAAAGTQYALENKEWQNGAFTYCLKQGLSKQQADADKDGITQLSELQEYLYEQVAELTKGKQKPTTRSANKALDFVIWK